MRPSHHFLQVLQGDVSVELGAGDPRVAQDGLDVPEVRMVTEHLSGHRVAESMRYFRAHPEKSWPVIFYENFDRARPNEAHLALARLENEGWPLGAGADGRGRLHVLITQNINNRHVLSAPA